jgi:type I restriction enzyme S subunit
MGDRWTRMTLEDAIEINPSRTISRGAVAPHISMELLQPVTREICDFEMKEFKGSGSRFQNDDTLLARITPCLENGKTAFVSCLPDGAVGHGSTEFIVLSGKEGISDTLFVYYLARDPDFRNYAIQHMEGSTGRQRVPASAIVRLTIDLPPLPEQKAIASILGALDDKIELNRKMNETLEAMARAIFKSWFVNFDPIPGLDPHKEWQDSPLGRIPKGWRVSSIGDEVKVVGGSTPSTKEPTFWEGGTFCWATPKDLASLASPVLLETERLITEKGLQQISSGLLPKGTVLLSSRAPIGYLAISEVSVAINQGFIAMICDQELPNHYVLHWAKENMDSIEVRANGTTFLEVSKRNFRPIPITVPPSHVLQVFNQQAEGLYQRIVNNLKESRTLSAIRDTLLPRLLSGEIRVKVAERFVEEVA